MTVVSTFARSTHTLIPYSFVIDDATEYQFVVFTFTLVVVKGPSLPLKVDRHGRGGTRLPQRRVIVGGEFSTGLGKNKTH